MIKAVIFDIDGVLLDSEKDSARLFQDLMKAVGHRPPTFKEYKKIFHLTLLDTLKFLIGPNDLAAVQKAWDLFINKTITYPGKTQKLPKNGATTIIKLSQNYQLALVTSRVKSSVYLSDELSKLKKYFRIAISYEDTTRHKPDPAPLLLATKKLKLKPDECVYIGDMPSDITAARAAGMKMILYSKKSPTLGADAKIKSFLQLPQAIKNLI